MGDLIFFKKGIPVGIVVPSVFYSLQGTNLVVDGPGGIAHSGSMREHDLHMALLESNALVEGSRLEINKVIELLEDPVYSRTVSYLLCHAKSCSDVLDDILALQNARVMIVGCGGIGSSLCMLLAGAGVRDFVLVDADVVEKSNLNRQLFWTLQDVGFKKVMVLKAALEARFESLKIKCIDSNLQIEDVCNLSGGDIGAVAITADDPATLARDGWRVADACNVPVVSGGYMHHLSASFHFVPGDCVEVARAAESLSHEEWFCLPSSIMPSYGPMNLSLASVLSSNLIASIARCSFGAQQTSCTRWDFRKIL